MCTTRGLVGLFSLSSRIFKESWSASRQSAKGLCRWGSWMPPDDVGSSVAPCLTQTQVELDKQVDAACGSGGRSLLRVAPGRCSEGLCGRVQGAGSSVDGGSSKTEYVGC